MGGIAQKITFGVRWNSYDPHFWGVRRLMTYKELVQRLKAAKNNPEHIVVQLDARAAARNGSITVQECKQLIVESRRLTQKLQEKRR